MKKIIGLFGIIGLALLTLVSCNNNTATTPTSDNLDISVNDKKGAASTTKLQVGKYVAKRIKDGVEIENFYPSHYLVIKSDTEISGHIDSDFDSTIYWLTDDTFIVGESYNLDNVFYYSYKNGKPVILKGHYAVNSNYIECFIYVGAA